MYSQELEANVCVDTIKERLMVSHPTVFPGNIQVFHYVVQPRADLGSLVISHTDADTAIILKVLNPSC